MIRRSVSDGLSVVVALFYHLPDAFLRRGQVNVDDFMGQVKEYRSLSGRSGSMERPKTVSASDQGMYVRLFSFFLLPL